MYSWQSLLDKGDSRKHSPLTAKYVGTQSHVKDLSVLTQCVLGWVAHKSFPNIAACLHSLTSAREIKYAKITKVCCKWLRQAHTPAGCQVIIENITVLTGALKRASCIITYLLACVRKECALVHICIVGQKWNSGTWRAMHGIRSFCPLKPAHVTNNCSTVTSDHGIYLECNYMDSPRALTNPYNYTRDKSHGLM